MKGVVFFVVKAKKQSFSQWESLKHGGNSGFKIFKPDNRLILDIFIGVKKSLDESGNVVKGELVRPLLMTKSQYSVFLKRAA